jgi:hypothetical protein
MTNATPTRQSTTVRSLLWVLLTITAVANATTSTMGMNPVISISFGLVTLATGVGLVANYRRNR